METYFVTLGSRVVFNGLPIRLELELAVKADDIVTGPLEIERQQLDAFCGMAALNMRTYSRHDRQVLVVKVQRGDEPPVLMEMSVNVLFGPEMPQFAYLQDDMPLPDCQPVQAAEFAIAWGENYMRKDEAKKLKEMSVPDAILTLRSAFRAEIADYVIHLAADIVAVGGEVEDDEGSYPSQIAERYVFADQSVAYFTAQGVVRELLDEDGFGVRYTAMKHPSTTQEHEMVSFAKH